MKHGTVGAPSPVDATIRIAKTAIEMKTGTTITETMTGTMTGIGIDAVAANGIAHATLNAYRICGPRFFTSGANGPSRFVVGSASAASGLS